MTIQHLRFRASTLAAAALCAMCLTGSRVRAQGPGLRAGLAALNTPVLLDTLARTYPIAGARMALLTAIVSAYDSLGIPIDFRDTRVGIVVAERFTVRQELKKVPLSRYVDCGQGMNGVNANVYRLTLVVGAWLQPAGGDPAKLQIAVAGSGQDMAGSNSQSVLCTTKGVLEDLLANIVRKKLATVPGGDDASFTRPPGAR